MSVPTYDRFIEPILRYLAQHPNGAAAKDVHDAAARELQITDADRQELLPSGAQPIYKNRAGWAHDRLKRAGLSSSPRRGYWQLTQEGWSSPRSINLHCRTMRLSGLLATLWMFGFARRRRSGRSRQCQWTGC